MKSTVAERITALAPAQVREYFTWRDAGLSMEAALGKVEAGDRPVREGKDVPLIEGAGRRRVTVQEADDGAEFDHLFTRPVREAAAVVPHDMTADEERAEVARLKALIPELEAKIHALETVGESTRSPRDLPSDSADEFDHLFSTTAGTVR